MEESGTGSTQIIRDPDPGGFKNNISYGFGSGSKAGSGTMSIEQTFFSVALTVAAGWPSHSTIFTMNRNAENLMLLRTP
jgi:hypothetical protein